MKYELSICIPTYNRKDCLKDLLESILSQADCPMPVEICISDDASSDDTETLVREYQETYPHIAYYRFPSNVGLDCNLLKSVALAHGHYCWLMGNDDKLEQGAVTLVTKLVKEYKEPTVLNVNGWQYDNQLKERLHDRVKKGLKKSILQTDQLFDNLEDILSLFGDSFGFLGDNVFKSALWNEVVSSSDLNRYKGSCYIHLAVLLMMLQQSPRFLYIHQHCVGFRGNNDGFLEILGQLRRLKLDVVGYNQVAEGVFSRKSRLYKMWMSRIVKVHIRSRVLGIKLSPSGKSMREAASLTYNYFANLPAFWVYIFPILLVPRSVLLGLRACYRSTIKRLRQDRLKRPKAENA
jgi:abequosyltransferase